MIDSPAGTASAPIDRATWKRGLRKCRIPITLILWAVCWSQSAIRADPIVNTVQAGQQEASTIAVNSQGDYVVVWQDDEDGNGYFDLYARGFHANGSQRFSTRRVNTARAGQQLDPAVAMDDAGRWVVAWEDDQNNDGNYDILVKGFNASGSTWFSARRVNEVSGDHRNPDVSMSYSREFAVAWQEDSDTNGYFNVYAQLFDGSTALGNNFQVHETPAGQQINPAVGYGWGVLVVAWQDDTDGNGYYDIRLAEFETYFNGFFLTWMYRREVRVNSNASGRQRFPDLAFFGAGAYWVVWQDDADGNGYYDIMGAGFERYNRKTIDDFVVNQVRAGQQTAPSISVGGLGDFVVTWQGDSNYDGLYDIRARGFYLSGNEKFRETVVDLMAEGQKLRPGAASDTAEGRTFFVWDGDVDGNGLYDIHSGQVGVATCDLLSSIDLPGTLDEDLEDLIEVAPEFLETGVSDYLESFNHYRGLAAQYTTFLSGGQMTEQEKQSDIMATTGSVFESEGREHFALVEVGQMQRDGLISQDPKRRLERITYQLPADCEEDFALPELVLVEGHLEAKSGGAPLSGVLREVGFSPGKRLELNLRDLPNWNHATRYDGQLYVGGDLTYKLLKLEDAAVIFDWDTSELAGRGDLELSLGRGSNSHTFASGSTNVLVEVTSTGVEHYLAARGSIGSYFQGVVDFVGDVSLVDLPYDGDMELNGHWVVDSDGHILDLWVAYKGFEMDYGDFAVGNLSDFEGPGGVSLGNLVGGMESGILDDVLDVAGSALGALSGISGVAPLSPTLTTTVHEVSLGVGAVNGEIVDLTLALEMDAEACVLAQYYVPAWCSSPWPGYPCLETETLAEFCEDADLDIELDLLSN